MPCSSPSRAWTLSLVACVLASAARADEPRPSADPDAGLLKTAARLYEDIRTETLANGLRVYLKPVPGASTVTTMMAYKVGSADEDGDVTGLSHYLEHLMFKGTDKLLPGDIDRLTQRNGGKNNAYTTEDMTVFHFDFAAERWAGALEVEADRMRNLRIDAKHEFEQEKGAVIAELEGAEDQPWEIERKTVLPQLFGPKSPYGHPVIGERAHVRGATAEVIKRYYDTWYHPNNAALIVCGGFDPDDALPRIRKLFGGIPKAELPERKALPKATPRPETVRLKIDSKFEQPRLMLAFNTVPSGEADAYALDVLQYALAGGKTTRLYQRLVEEDRLASSVTAYHSSGRYPGWFAIEVESLEDDLKKVEAAVNDELGKLAASGLPPEEWRRVRRGLIANFIFAHEAIHDMADTIAESVTTHDLAYLHGYLPRLAAVTADDLKQAAKKYFVDAKGVVIWARPAPEDPKNDKTQARGQFRGARPARLSPVPQGQPRGTAPRSLPRRRQGEARPGPAQNAFTLKNAKSVTLDNGLILLLMENHRLPIVAAEAYVRQVHLREPADKSGVAALVGEMLTQGTTTRTGKQIARVIEDVGGVFTTDAAGGTVKVLAPDTDLGLELLFDSLMNPNFPDDELEHRRELLITDIEDEEGAPRSRAALLFHQLVYGKRHPYGRSTLGQKAVVEKLTPADCRDFHRSVFRPNNTLVAVVGDFEADKLVAGIKKRTASWKREELPPLPEFPVKKNRKPIQRIETDREAAQVHVYLGHLGVRRDNPDYHTLLVLDNVLGTGPGFTDRLSASLRDRQGLAYAVNAVITASADEEPGTFVGYIGTYPDKFEVVKQGYLKEVRRIRAEAPSQDEVDNAKKYLLGNVAFRFTTNSAIAKELLELERFRLGFGYLEKYRSAIEAVTPEAVHAAAKQYLDPDRVILVAVGPIDQEGKPLKQRD